MPQLDKDLKRVINMETIVMVSLVYTIVCGLVVAVAGLRQWRSLRNQEREAADE
jgi:hypothetical protein